MNFNLTYTEARLLRDLLTTRPCFATLLAELERAIKDHEEREQAIWHDDCYEVKQEIFEIKPRLTSGQHLIRDIEELVERMVVIHIQPTCQDCGCEVQKQ
jgi:hypothetical protein